MGNQVSGHPSVKSIKMAPTPSQKLLLTSLEDAKRILEQEPTLIQSEVPHLTEENTYPLPFLIARYGSVEVMKLLKEKGSNLNVQTDGWNLQHFACAGQNLSMIDFLVSSGLYLVSSSDGISPIEVAVNDDCSKTLQHAIEYHDYSCDSPLSEGWTPLTRACFFGYIEMVRDLISAGASVNLGKRSNENSPPLHIAAVNNNIEIVKMLLGAGAEVDGLDSTDNTALMLAAKKGYRNISSLQTAD